VQLKIKASLSTHTLVHVFHACRYFPDGSQYTGNWHKGVIHGWGVYVYNNGDEYEGWWYMGVKNGRGIYRTKSTNEKFIGNWLLGLRHGKGMLIRPEHRFIGNWYKDVVRYQINLLKAMLDVSVINNKQTKAR